MKRTPLLRKTPMRRTRMKRSTRRNTYAKRPRFTAYMLWVKESPCIVHARLGLQVDGSILYLADDACEGAIEADHAGARGMGQKCSDFEVVPLCKRHHDMRPGRRGPFASLTKEQMRDWVAAAISMTQSCALVLNAPDKEHLREYLKGKEA